MDTKEEQLVAKAMAGDMDAFSALCRQNENKIHYLCVGIMGNEPDGQDAMQEVYIKMQRGITRLRSPQAFTVWLHRIVVNVCTDLRRKQIRQPQQSPLEIIEGTLPEDNADYIPHEHVDKDEKNRQLLELVSQLPYRQRVSMLLYYYEGMSYANIASVLNTSVRAVENYLRRGKQTIKSRITGIKAVAKKTRPNDRTEHHSDTEQ